MSKYTILLFSSLLFIMSCTNTNEVHFKETDFSDISGYKRYILPQNTDRLMQQMRYSNRYNISITIDRGKKFCTAVLHLYYYNDTGLDLEQIQFRLLMNNAELKPMAVHNVEVGDLPVSFELSGDGSTMIIPLERKLIHGKTAELKISYSIDFSNAPSYYFDFARIDEKGFSIPHFFPVAAVNKRGIWENDQISYGGDLLSADSSWFIVEIITDDDVIIVTSGIEVESELRKGMQKKVFSAGPVRDFFICGDESFIPSVTLSGDTDIISYSYNQNSSSSAEAAAITSSAVALFSSIYGVYPFKELKLSSLPMSALGIEFPGLFAISDKLYNDPDGMLFEPTIVHETAHQWFYSLLGNNQLREPWIDESLTQYSVWLYYRERYGSQSALSLFNSFIERWDRVDRADIPINKEVGFYKGKEYGAIIYGRAPLFLIELRNLMGEKEFHKFLRHLIQHYSQRQISTEIFREELIHFTGSAADGLFGEYFD